MNLPSEQEHAPQPPQTITAGEWIASKTAGSEQGRAGTGFALTSMSMPKTSTCLARAVCSSCFPPRAFPWEKIAWQTGFADRRRNLWFLPVRNRSEEHTSELQSRGHL